MSDLEKNAHLVAELQTALEGFSISEAASEIQDAQSPPKPKRGRPRLDGCWDHAFGNSEAKSERGMANSRYAYDAARALFQHRESHPEVLELTGFKTIEKSFVFPDGCIHDDRKWKFGVLVELGRLMWKYSDGVEVAVQLAIELANMRPPLTSKQAVGWIRNQRLQQSKEGRPSNLVGAITRAIDQFLAFHPGTTPETVQAALETALAIYDDDELEAHQ